MRLIILINGFTESVEYTRDQLGWGKLDQMIYDAAVTGKTQEAFYDDNRVAVYFE